MWQYVVLLLLCSELTGDIIIEITFGKMLFLHCFVVLSSLHTDVKIV